MSRSCELWAGDGTWLPLGSSLWSRWTRLQTAGEERGGGAGPSGGSCAVRREAGRLWRWWLHGQLAGKWPPDISHILQVKWQVFADGLDAAVSGRESRPLQVFHPDRLLSRAPPEPSWLGLPNHHPPGPRPQALGQGPRSPSDLVRRPPCHQMRTELWTHGLGSQQGPGRPG